MTHEHDTFLGKGFAGVAKPLILVASPSKIRAYPRCFLKIIEHCKYCELYPSERHHKNPIYIELKKISK